MDVGEEGRGRGLSGGCGGEDEGSETGGEVVGGAPFVL